DVGASRPPTSYTSLLLFTARQLLNDLLCAEPLRLEAGDDVAELLDPGVLPLVGGPRHPRGAGRGLGERFLAQCRRFRGERVELHRESFQFGHFRGLRSGRVALLLTHCLLLPVNRYRPRSVEVRRETFPTVNLDLIVL